MELPPVTDAVKLWCLECGHRVGHPDHELPYNAEQCDCPSGASQHVTLAVYRAERDRIRRQFARGPLDWNGTA